MIRVQKTSDVSSPLPCNTRQDHSASDAPIHLIPLTTMKLPASLVTIHPYFKIHPGKEEQVAAVLEEFVAKTRSEAKCLFYEFSCLEDVVFCREGYEGAEGVNHHLENIGEVLAEMLTVSDLTRLEFHGPSEEIDQLRGPLGHLNADWFVLRCGI